MNKRKLNVLVLSGIIVAGLTSFMAYNFYQNKVQDKIRESISIEKYPNVTSDSGLENEIKVKQAIEEEEKRASEEKSKGEEDGKKAEENQNTKVEGQANASNSNTAVGSPTTTPIPSTPPSAPSKPNNPTTPNKPSNPPPAPSPAPPKAPEIVNDKIINPVMKPGTTSTPVLSDPVRYAAARFDSIKYDGSMSSTFNMSLALYVRGQLSLSDVKNMYMGKVIDSKYRITNVILSKHEYSEDNLYTSDGSMISDGHYKYIKNSGFTSNKYGAPSGGALYDKFSGYRHPIAKDSDPITYMVVRMVVVMSPVK